MTASNVSPLRAVITITCLDRTGIVAAVSGFLTKQGCFIEESAQFGDPSTNRFFLRMVFVSEHASIDALRSAFAAIATEFAMQWQLVDSSQKMRVLLMVSKQGQCLNHMLYRYHAGHLPVEIPAIISNHPDLKREADFYNIPFHHLPVSADNKSKQEQEVIHLVKQYGADLVVLARYMQILSPMLVAQLQGKAINIHHSFLPSFKGAKPYHQAYDRGVKIIGATAHFVSNDLDEGPIIEQEVIRVDHTDSPERLVQLGGDIESRVLFRAVQFFIEHRVLVNGDKTVVFR